MVVAGKARRLVHDGYYIYASINELLRHTKVTIRPHLVYGDGMKQYLSRKKLETRENRHNYTMPFCQCHPTPAALPVRKKMNDLDSETLLP